MTSAHRRRFLRLNPLAFMEQRFERLGDTFVQGDYVHTRDPRLAYSALVSDASCFRRVDSPLRPLLGRSLGLADGEFWRERRVLMQPAFRQALITHAEIVVDLTNRALIDWTSRKELDIYRAFRVLMLRIMAKSLLGWTPADEVLESLVDQLQVVTELGSLLRATGEDDVAWSSVRDAFAELIDLSSGHGPILTALWRARDRNEISEEDVQQEIYGLLLAGQDTVVLTLALAMWTHSSVPDLDVDDPEARSHYLREILRLYPPAYAIPRCATKQVGPVGPDQQLVMWTYFIHRSEQLYDDARVLRPERWREIRPAPGSYLPFGAGGHRCIGEKIAMMTLDTCLLTIGKRVAGLRRLGSLPTFLPFVTLTPAEPMLVEWRRY